MLVVAMATCRSHHNVAMHVIEPSSWKQNCLTYLYDNPLMCNSDECVPPPWVCIDFHGIGSAAHLLCGPDSYSRSTCSHTGSRCTT